MYFRFISLAALTLWCQALSAAAWLQEPGSGLAILTLRDYESDQYWDADGNRRDTSTYSKKELTPFIEYGLTNDLTIGTKLYLLDITHTGFGTESGLGDVELFGRLKLWSSDWEALSAQFLLKVPSGYDKDASPSLGAGQYDLEARLLYGDGGVWDKQTSSTWYFGVEAAVRKRFEDPEDEFRLDWTVGWRSPSQKWEWEFLQENLIALSHSANSADRWADFDLYKVTPSGRYWFSPHTAFQFGITQDVAGRNTGQGSTAFAALWLRF